jgi:hypothetical protein
MKDKKTEGKSPRKFRWSAVDTCILLLVLAVLGGLVYRVADAALGRQDNGKRVMYAVYFTVEDTHMNVLSEVRGFDAVYDYEDGAKLGHIAAYEDPATGEYAPVMTVKPAVNIANGDYVSATGCMICTSATESGGSLRVDGSGRYLTPGATLMIRTDRALLTVRITEIRVHG